MQFGGRFCPQRSQVPRVPKSCRMSGPSGNATPNPGSARAVLSPLSYTGPIKSFYRRWTSYDCVVVRLWQCPPPLSHPPTSSPNPLFPPRSLHFLALGSVTACRCARFTSDSYQQALKHTFLHNLKLVHSDSKCKHI